MNKSELIAKIAGSADLSNAQASSALDALVDSVVAAVAAGDKVAIAGFGTFEPRQRSARTGRNPQTGDSIEIAASTAPAFKPASAFKKAVNG